MDVRRCPACAENVEARLRACPFCETLLDPPPRSDSTAPIWLRCAGVSIFTLGCLTLAIALVLVILNSGTDCHNQRNASGSLKTVATAQADFRSNDRDNNGIADFWTGDIAGLYCIDNASTGPGNPSPIKLIEVSIALADLKPSPGLNVRGINNYGSPVEDYGTVSAKAGYWYCVLIEDLEAKTPYAQNTGTAGVSKHNLMRFGAAAMPESYGASGNLVFLITEDNAMHQRDFGADVLETGVMPPTPTGRFDLNRPTNSTLREAWKVLD